ncbi:MAG TPA: hypothetical protein VFS00_08895 [Polyangiaceae bacterium]|nr:hypothetical protein [Polyangiaceae bacterium]
MSDVADILAKIGSRGVTGEELEVLGKRAASLWSSGRAPTLSDAVVEAVKHASLSTEQVKRVIEFANTEAYLGEHRRMGGSDRVVDFGRGGPASPSDVLPDLRDGGGGGENVTLGYDYSEAPKTASALPDEALWELFRSSGGEDPHAEPLAEAVALRAKLAGDYGQATTELSSVRVLLDGLGRHLGEQVKQAAYAGHPLSQVVGAWSAVSTPGAVKRAFAAVVDGLVGTAFRTYEDVAGDLEKSAAKCPPLPPDLVFDYVDYCLLLEKEAELEARASAMGEGAAELTEFLKSAAAGPGALARAGAALNTAGRAAGRGGEAVGEFLLGPGKGRGVGRAAEIGTKYVLPAVAANEAYRATLKHNPAAQTARRAVLSAIPGTQEYNERDYQLALRGQGMY